MTPQESRFESEQQTRGEQEKPGYKPERDNSSDQRRSTTSPGQRRKGKIRPDSPVHDNIQERGSNSDKQRSDASSYRRGHGEIRFDNTPYLQGRESHSNTMTNSNQGRSKENRADCPATTSGRTTAQTQECSDQRPGRMDLPGSREPRHSGNPRGHTGQKLGKSHFPLRVSEHINSLLTELCS